MILKGYLWIRLPNYIKKDFHFYYFTKGRTKYKIKYKIKSQQHGH